MEFNLNLPDLPGTWVIMAIVVMALTGVVFMGIVLLKASRNKEGGITLNFSRSWKSWTVIILGCIAMIIAATIAVHSIIDRFGNDGGSSSASGEPVVSVQFEDRYVGSSIIYCIPEVASDDGVHLPSWAGGFLYNSPTAKFTALGKFNVGIDNFSEFANQSLRERTEVRKIREGVSQRVVVVEMDFPLPTIDNSDPTLFFEGQNYENLTDEVKDDYGEAFERCQGASRFRDISCGGVLQAVACPFIGPEPAALDTATAIAVDEAYRRATEADPSDDTFNGRTALEQAQENVRKRIKQMVLERFSDRIEELEDQGKTVEVRINFIGDEEVNQTQP